MARLTAKTRYDDEGCFAKVYDGERELGSSYRHVHFCDSWEACRDEAVADALKKAVKVAALGPPPAEEEFEVGPEPLHAV